MAHGVTPLWIFQLLPELVGASQWLKSEQAQFFSSTLFPDLSLIDQFPAPNSQSPRSRWERYLELRPQIIDLEASIAEEYISPELMEALRHRNLENALRHVDRPLVAQIQAQITGYLRGGTFNARRLADCVNYIRQRPDDFPEWHRSATAELFSPPIFQNKKKSSGYFF